VTDFKQLIASLVESDVEFIVVGGLAATVHGSARLTQDVDVVYSRSHENIERMVTALAPFEPYLRGAPPGLPFEWSTATIKSGLNFTLTTTIGDIDVLGEIAGGGFYDALVEHTIVIDLFGHECKCLDLPTLIATKRAAGRPRDLEAIAELEALHEEREGQ
jgi:predicted nucleotidyltransferase